MTNTVTKATNFFSFALKKFMLVAKRRGVKFAIERPLFFPAKLIVKSLGLSFNIVQLKLAKVHFQIFFISSPDDALILPSIA